MTFDGIPPCTSDPAMFFSTNPARREDAKRVCATCPFQEPCRDLSNRPMITDEGIYAVANGIWAGEDKALTPDTLTPLQRRTQQRTEEVRLLLQQPGITKAEIGRRVGISAGSVNHIIDRYLTPKEAA